MGILCSFLFLLTFLNGVILDTNEIRDLIRTYRFECLDQSGIIGGGGLIHNSTSIKLRSLGPEALPVLMDEWCENEPWNMHMACASFFFSYSGIRWYYIGSEFHHGDRCDMSDIDKSPLPLLTKWDVGLSPKGENMLSEREQILAWWAQHNSYLKREGVKQEIRSITGTKSEDFLNYNWTAYRKYVKHCMVYGIFNYPWYFEVILEDNNPIVFGHWCNTTNIDKEAIFSNSPRFDHNFGIEDGEARTWVTCLQSRFPTRTSKFEVIVKWWDKNKEGFMRLPELYQAIDEQVQKMRNFKE